MSKRLTVLMCALIFLGFAGLAAAEPAPTAQPAFFSQVASCSQAVPVSILEAAPSQESACQGWLYGSCDRRADCVGFYCPLGEVKTCVGGTGSGCNGICDCVP
jgi:hypothetical protein